MQLPTEGVIHDGGMHLQDGRGEPNPYSARERLLRVAWAWAYCIVYRLVPRQANAWHRSLLRLFGARVGRGVTIYPSARVYFPWMLELGDFTVVGDNVNIYNLGRVRVGKHTVISQNVHICAGTHNYADIRMPLLRLPIDIGEGCWLCADAFLGPGCSVGDGAVVGARSVVTGVLPPHMVCAGNPCRPLKHRWHKESRAS